MLLGSNYKHPGITVRYIYIMRNKQFYRKQCTKIVHISTCLQEKLPVGLERELYFHIL